MSTPLSRYFDGVVYKRLSAVEADADRSNQHEFNGTAPLRQLLGTDARREFSAQFIHLDDQTEQPLTAPGQLTWYESRKPPRSEFRLYFKDNPVLAAAKEGDLLVIGRRPNGTLLVLVADAHSTAENQVILLFDLPPNPGQELALQQLAEDGTKLNRARAFILEQLGIEVVPADPKHLERLLQKFPDGFPATREFSAFARETMPEVSALDDPDAALLAWWDREEMLFRTYERHLLGERLREGFGDDVDAFLAYSLSVHQTRKSRAGYALENHLQRILEDHEIRYSRGKVTENNAKPDYIFPGITEYHQPEFPVVRLSMLGVKSTCKDRWRQVLSEAERIPEKHLLTLEPSITVSQTDEMNANRLRLVLPTALHSTYRSEQLAWLMNLRSFIDLVRARQADA